MTLFHLHTVTFKLPEYSLVFYICFRDYRIISGNIIAPDLLCSHVEFLSIYCNTFQPNLALATTLSQLLYAFNGLFIYDYEVIIYVIVVLHE